MNQQRYSVRFDSCHQLGDFVFVGAYGSGGSLLLAQLMDSTTVLAQLPRSVRLDAVSPSADA